MATVLFFTVSHKGSISFGTCDSPFFGQERIQSFSAFLQKSMKAAAALET